ncbi:PspC domain-containing protein [Macrococcoides caseolyticum]|uniref:PspC domain-containing protein n=1 Tax=Macrococcoides caseolyticum TaxID=69966 RepID=UPI001F3E5375|nr:PspC domain-containing protein [Macrococcus caseolyticus]MCE4958056.1 PspC domain-containing protein [Macrococcus caseolyticus]
MNKKLTRSTSDKYLAGVLGGIAEYLQVDSTNVRIIFILVSFFTIHIPTFFIYFILAIILPKDTYTR